MFAVSWLHLCLVDLVMKSALVSEDPFRIIFWVREMGKDGVAKILL